MEDILDQLQEEDE
jgi:HrpA-like RNA helicase